MGQSSGPSLIAHWREHPLLKLGSWESILEGSSRGMMEPRIWAIEDLFAFPSLESFLSSVYETLHADARRGP